MKKITLLLSFIVCVVFAQAQTNLVVNPSFETWTDGSASPWYVVGTPTGYTMTSENTIVLDGTQSCKMNVPSTASRTISVSQGISIVGGKTYTLNMSYYIASGDNTDARIWCNFKTGTTFFSEGDLVATGLYSKLRGPGNESSSGSSYFPDEKGAWKTYTIEFTAPSTADGFDFQFRTYKGAVVYWDKMSLVQKNSTGTSNPSEDALQAFVSGKNLVIKNAVNGSTVEIFSALGSKVQTSVLEDGRVSLDNLSKGLYVVRIGKKAQKFML